MEVSTQAPHQETLPFHLPNPSLLLRPKVTPPRGGHALPGQLKVEDAAPFLFSPLHGKLEPSSWHPALPGFLPLGPTREREVRKDSAPSTCLPRDPSLAWPKPYRLLPVPEGSRGICRPRCLPPSQRHGASTANWHLTKRQIKHRFRSSCRPSVGAASFPTGLP